MALEKCKKQCDMALNILLHGFCPLKIKITQFSDGFCLNKYLTLTDCMFLCTVLF